MWFGPRERVGLRVELRQERAARAALLDSKLEDRGHVLLRRGEEDEVLLRDRLRVREHVTRERIGVVEEAFRLEDLGRAASRVPVEEALERGDELLLRRRVELELGGHGPSEACMV